MVQVDSQPRHAAAVDLELFTHRFEAIAREMGEMLRRMALSTNIRERLDFSCALLDAEGRLVANAPHIPVHLGALGLCVRAVNAVLELGPGDVAITNHPGFGGSHLPDVTLISPVHDGSDPGRRVGYVASRAHHAEIGGTRPGSMPPLARSLAEEGVVIEPWLLVRAGESRLDELERRLRQGPFPSRAPQENLADVGAALAANRRGTSQLRALVARHGAEGVEYYMGALRQAARETMVRVLKELGDGVYQAAERLDDGSPLRVAIQVTRGRVCFDFTGSGAQHPGNLNATPAIVTSAVLYVLRLLIDRPLPLNEGLLEPVTLVLPTGMLAPVFSDDPTACPAVVGGNVETSQRLVDTLLKALGLAACSQGTMNNVLFGNDHFGYYETVCGGVGATTQGPGADAVHSHMTNTRCTDPEVLEARFPVRLERFAVRQGSGGRGLHRGGDGVVRELTFLEPVSVSLLTQHRVAAPYGLDGGAPGQRGAQRIVRRDGREETLAPIDAAELVAGDRLVLETPGGGGWGAPRHRVEASGSRVAGRE
jgi:5-oxoprolinase (ATP-hydrolysing)